MSLRGSLEKKKKPFALVKASLQSKLAYFETCFQGKILHTVALNIVNMHILLQAIILTFHQGISKKKWPLFTKLNPFSGTSASATLANGTNTVHSEDDHLYTSSLSLFIKARLGFSYFPSLPRLSLHTLIFRQRTQILAHSQ